MYSERGFAVARCRRALHSPKRGTSAACCWPLARRVSYISASLTIPRDLPLQSGSRHTLGQGAMKKYPTSSDIENMRDRGFDPSVLAEQLELAKRGAVLERLVGEVHLAFSGVTLGSGVGLLEANGRDDYANDQKLAAYREQDEKLDWNVIPVELLNRYSSSLSFFDAEGMRFHLPAFLIADMHGLYAFDLVYNLTQSTLTEQQCKLLTEPQRRVVRGYLQFVEAEDDRGFERAHIRRALEGYWAE